MLVGKMKKLLVCAAMLIAAGCAKRPDEIMATPVAVDPYMQMSCAQLGPLKMQKETELAKLEKAQFNASEHDKAAMSVIHIPVASMAGKDNEEGVARAKGEVQAINSAYQSKRCAAG
jgi:hypothetical protein